MLFLQAAIIQGNVFEKRPQVLQQDVRLFPLDLYQRDCRRATQLAARLSVSLDRAALRFCLEHPAVSSAILGLSEVSHLDTAIDALESGPLSTKDKRQIAALSRMIHDD